MGFVIGPVPAESNPPIEPQFYNPSRFNISAISNGQTTTVTTSEDHNYVIGQLVRLTIPFVCQEYELNEQSGIVISLPSSTQVEVQIFSLGFNSFVAAPATGTQPQILAIGDTNSGQTNTSGRTNQLAYIPGSFINVSPA